MAIRRVGEKFRVAHGRDKNGWKLTRPTAVYECDCGTRFVMQCRSERGTKSCGCLARETARKLLLGNTNRRVHNMTGTPTHKSWLSMRARCYQPNHIEYHRYGARGIKVCDRWQHFENFLQDMGVRPRGMTIDRLDPNGDYTPDNCRWATTRQQCRNKRNNVLVTCDGVTKTVAEWAEDPETDSASNMYQRVASGWTGRDVVYGRGASCGQT